jgi:hypothetical protein
MQSVSRQVASSKASPILQTSSSYINENRYFGKKQNNHFLSYFVSNSTESGFGSDIFDLGATDFGRQSSTHERVIILH